MTRIPERRRATDRRGGTALEACGLVIAQLACPAYCCTAGGAVRHANNAARRLWGACPDPGENGRWDGFTALYGPDGSALDGPVSPAALAARTGLAQPPAELLPSGYKVPPGTAVSGMGVHAVNLASQEFHGKPFTATFIYGYFDRRLTFVEPMVTVDFLRSKPSFSEEVARPRSYTFSGRYPSAYSVKYDPTANVYEIGLESLK